MRTPTIHRTAVRLLATLLVPMVLSLGCADDTDLVREIQSQRQNKLQETTQQDHLEEVFSLLSRLVELNPQEANRQITYHLNQWREDHPGETDYSVTSLISTVSDVLPKEAAVQAISQVNFVDEDVKHLRDCYLFKQLASWIDSDTPDDQLLTEWFASVEQQLGEDELDRLRTVSRLFDWTIRNIAYEPKEQQDSAPPPKEISLGMKFRGAGYRQTNYQTVWRGTGDSLQRAGVFIHLCRQVGVPAFMLARQAANTGTLEPWCVGALIGKEIYLFETELGTFIPGPNQVGIATLAQARDDASVLRRLNVAGFFEYPFKKEDIQQCIVLLNVLPEAISARMKHLESGLTGDRRMQVYVDADRLAKDIDEVSGIAGVRLWNVPLLAEVYQRDMEKSAKVDPLFAFWHLSRWAILEANIDMSQQLAMARWRHLAGDFGGDAESDTKGARVLYLSQRAPEFEIEDLLIDVDLQQAYGVRRELGVATETYNAQIKAAQGMMRQGKRTATYWISLIQYDDGLYETAESWFTKRVLIDEQLSQWAPSARYNLARTYERLGQQQRSIEIFKTEGEPQEHGNRIRARLLSKSAEE